MLMDSEKRKVCYLHLNMIERVLNSNRITGKILDTESAISCKPMKERRITEQNNRNVFLNC